MFNNWMMVTNLGIMSGVWITLVCLVAGVILYGSISFNC